MLIKKLYKSSDSNRISDTDFATTTKAENYRSCWRHDYARIIHSSAFRRLQGKTQLFPNHESDFFRNRLTHSLEVAQIAKSIAQKINLENRNFSASEKTKINPDIVEAAALVHDIGHPPFGHNGEKALDEKMKKYGGFEGNAQTIRILCKLEKKEVRDGIKSGEMPDCLGSLGEDLRYGLNLTARVLGAALKYDNEIPYIRESNSELNKGYYATEAATVKFIKESILGKKYKDFSGKFKTIECCIMDIADDISYSTYDFEDALKGGFLNPLQIMASPQEILEKVAKKVEERIKKAFPNESEENKKFTPNDAIGISISLFKPLYENIPKEIAKSNLKDKYINSVATAVLFWKTTKQNAENGYLRTRLTSRLVGRFIDGVKVQYNKDYPELSKAFLDLQTFKEVEVLKNFAFESVIMSSRLKLAEHRGQDIVAKIFDALASDRGHMLMPDDYKDLYTHINGAEKMRVICDFIAGMTDKYALEFYNRLYGATAESIHKPI